MIFDQEELTLKFKIRKFEGENHWWECGRCGATLWGRDNAILHGRWHEEIGT